MSLLISALKRLPRGRSGLEGTPGPRNTFSTVAPRAGSTQIAHAAGKEHAKIVPPRSAYVGRAIWPGAAPRTVHRPGGSESITGALSPFGLACSDGAAAWREGSTMSTVLRTGPTWITCAPSVVKTPS